MGGLQNRDQLRNRASLALRPRRIVRVRIKPGIVNLQEDPLGPAVKLRVGGGDGTALIVTQSQAPQLALHVLNVGHGRGARVGAGLHGVLLGGQAEGVITQGVQHVCAIHTVETSEHIRRDVAQRVANVQAHARWIREHVLHEHAIFGQRASLVGQITHRVRSVERAMVGPMLLPTLLNLCGEGGGVAVRSRGRRSALVCLINWVRGVVHDSLS